MFAHRIHGVDTLLPRHRRPGAARVGALAFAAFLAWSVGIAANPADASASRGLGQRSTQEDLDALAWLEGEWHRPIRGGTAIERWSALPGGGLTGEVVVMRDGGSGEVHTEALLLVAMGADVFYIPRPRENPYPVAFRLISLDDGVAVFENPTHDFPQRIIYRRTGDAAFTATIEGPGDDGQLQRIDFDFTRR